MYKLTIHYYTTNFGSNHQHKDQLAYHMIQSDTYFTKSQKSQVKFILWVKRVNDDKEQIKKIGEKGEAMNNMIAIVDKFCVTLVLHQIIYFIKLKL